MSADVPAVNVVESNPYAPRPFVFTEVAVCLVDAIRASGFRSEHLVNCIDPAAFSIVLGGAPRMQGELEHMDPRRCAIFNFEQLASGSFLAGPEHLNWLANWLVLDYHGHNLEVLRRTNGLRQRSLEVPIKPSPSLVTMGHEACSVDVLFYGTMNERRAQVLHDLQALGLSVEIVAGAYAGELAPAVRRARLVLHVHFYDTGLFPVARMLQPAVMGVPIVCETSVFSSSNDWSNSGIVFSDLARLAGTCKSLLDDPNSMQLCATRVQAFCSSIDFSTSFRAVLAEFAALSLTPSCSALRGDESAELPGSLHEPASGSFQKAFRDGEEPIADAQIEQLLISEGAQPPEAHTTPPSLSVIKREPGQGRMGKWIGWLLVAMMLLGTFRYWMDWKV